MSISGETGEWHVETAGGDPRVFALRRGKLFLLDGASGAGKTTLALALAEEHPQVDFVPRYATRQPRPGEPDHKEYIFIPPADFRQMAADDEFIEYRDYEFGMSYGIPWKEVGEILDRGRNAVAIMNLDRVQVVKERFPEAVVILIDASLEVIEQRLRARGANTPEQIAERLGNAQAVSRLRHYYDYIVNNESDPAEALRRLRAIVDENLAADEPAAG
jgi:guanylate kinase